MYALKKHSHHAARTSTSTRPSISCNAKARKPREIVVGIDLGTTNSAVAYIENGKPKCIPNADGEPITPSVVTFLPDGDVAVGKAARRMAASQPSTTYYSVKRIIGRPFNDPIVQEESKRLAFEVSKDDNGQVILPCTSVDRGYIYPEEVSAQVLAQLLDDAEAYTGGEVKKAVISVPAYFDNHQREVSANAGKLAGLEVVRIIREPVAAALAYGLNLKEDQTVLVFDLGGGTYDISLLEVGNGTIEVLSTGGDAHLGGDDWDALLMDWISHTHLRKNDPSLNPDNDPKLKSNLRALAEAAKKQLSDNEEVTVRMPVGGPGGGPLQLTLSRAMIEKMGEPLWKRARLPLDQACWAAGVDLNSIMTEIEEKREKLAQRGVPSWKTETMRPEIRPKARNPLSRVLLVGGASRMPAVSSFITNMTGLVPELGTVNPDEAVALGAAVQAGILQGEVKDLMVMDQWQASLMRAMAKMKLKQDATARAAVSQQFDMDSGTDELGLDDDTSAGDQQQGSLLGGMQMEEIAIEDDAEADKEEEAILRRLDQEHAAEQRRIKARSAAAAAEDNASQSSSKHPTEDDEGLEQEDDDEFDIQPAKSKPRLRLKGGRKPGSRR